MSTQKRKVGTIDLAPSWQTAVRIYCEILQSNESSHNAKKMAQADLMALAFAMDKINADKKTIASLQLRNKSLLEKVSNGENL